MVLKWLGMKQEAHKDESSTDIGIYWLAGLILLIPAIEKNSL